MKHKQILAQLNWGWEYIRKVG